jgi:hypothetical protein
VLIITPRNMADGLMSTEPALLEKAAIEDWIYGRARPLERMSALECGSRLANFRSGSKLRNLRSFGKRPLLMARLPRPPIIPPENQDLQRKPGAQLVEKRLARAAASRLSRAGR